MYRTRALGQLFDGCAGALDHESRKGMGIGLSICKSIVMAHQGVSMQETMRMEQSLVLVCQWMKKN